MPAPALQVVLTGAEHSQRQHLAQALQQVLAQLGCQSELLTPSQPSELASCPPEATHLLWTGVGASDWRQELHALKRAYQVVQGEPADALKQCVYALLPPAVAQDWARQLPPVRWQGLCETCGDAACEQRLFSGLLQR